MGVISQMLLVTTLAVHVAAVFERKGRQSGKIGVDRNRIKAQLFLRPN
jgi:hypothetical protein